ncbi:MAG TPA: hypothetical protein VE861_16310, partial [Gemmatimonadaceae bacterium]|nr:hypothetical protein [Gemmatimonadaceae bacterium]
MDAAATIARAADRALDRVRADTVIARRVRLAPESRFVVDTCSVPRLYFVVRGAVRIERPNAPTTWVRAGDTL